MNTPKTPQPKTAIASTFKGAEIHISEDYTAPTPPATADKQWKGYKWQDYQVAIVRQNHHISKLEAERDDLLRQRDSAQIGFSKLAEAHDIVLRQRDALAAQRDELKSAIISAIVQLESNVMASQVVQQLKKLA